MSAPDVPFICPWACLASSPLKLSLAPPSVVSNRSFAQALLNKADVSLNQLPKPCLKGNSLSIKISEDVYQSGLANCNNYLHGRLVLSRKTLAIMKAYRSMEDDSLGSGFF
ncbi:hypothetical protein A2U01_0022618 [Trifolium medium]|uniref:Uncharacterized protein n=1 Tax=Trifolium medium TaxID=97028 RepID=A0A392NP21_9FABA|nr:hypothetical protein [Trifolium medium]